MYVFRAPDDRAVVWNQVWSPEIDWDLPGTDDDDPAVAGLRLDFDVWRHFPIANLMFYQWGVRFFANGQWTNWRDYGFVYGLGTPGYVRSSNPITQFVEPGTEKLQIALGVIDIGYQFLTPPYDSTPAPWFDNVRLLKYRIGGPVMTTRDIDLANDAFPVSGTLDLSTQAARDALDVRFDRAISIVRGPASVDLVVPGDSVVVDVAAMIPGSSFVDGRLVWTLRQNPTFESAIRQPPARPGLDSGFATDVGPDGRTIWSGAVTLSQATTATGTVIQNRYFADLPDEDFLYPGDVLHYYLEATDDGGRTSTLPVDLTGFGVWDENGRSVFSRTFTMRALPSIDASGEHPDVLWVNDAGRHGQEEEVVGAFEQNGYLEGVHFDSYTVQGAVSGVGNGIGAAGRFSAAVGERRGHGATLEQVAGYATIVYTTHPLTQDLLGQGPNDDGFDPSDDLGLLTAWKNAPGRRASIWFGDGLASGTTQRSTTGAAFVSDVLGVDVVSADLAPSVGVARNLRAASQLTELPVGFAVYGLCPFARRFDQVLPGPGAVSTHALLDGAGDPVAGAVGGVHFDRLVGADRKVDLTFPFGLATIVDDLARTDALSARTRLLGAALTLAGAEAGVLVPTDAPAVRAASLEVAPTPFNPRTTITFILPRIGADASVRVYDVRGQLVRTLHDGRASTADLRLDWDGRDAQGAAVGSGVYFVRAETDGFAATRKVALVK